MSEQRARARQMADRIRVIVAETLERRIKDPRLGFVTITEARITNDLREASVFYTVLGSPEELAGTATALESAKGVLRSEVGRLTGVKHTPTLEFIADAVPENARYIEDLLERARSADEEVAAARAHATYAGEPDPYKHDDDENGEFPGTTADVPPSGDGGAVDDADGAAHADGDQPPGDHLDASEEPGSGQPAGPPPRP